jgi:hypothetical protein
MAVTTKNPARRATIHGSILTRPQRVLKLSDMRGENLQKISTGYKRSEMSGNVRNGHMPIGNVLYI